MRRRRRGRRRCGRRGPRDRRVRARGPHRRLGARAAATRRSASRGTGPAEETLTRWEQEALDAVPGSLRRRRHGRGARTARHRRRRGEHEVRPAAGSPGSRWRWAGTATPTPGYVGLHRHLPRHRRAAPDARRPRGQGRRRRQRAGVARVPERRRGEPCSPAVRDAGGGRATGSTSTASAPTTSWLPVPTWSCSSTSVYARSGATSSIIGGFDGIARRVELTLVDGTGPGRLDRRRGHVGRATRCSGPRPPSRWPG